MNTFKILIASLAITFSISLSSAKDDGFYAGMAEVNITPPSGVPLAGYGGRRVFPFGPRDKSQYTTYFRGATGKHDELRAKTLLLKLKDKYLLFISLDVVAIDIEFRKEILKSFASYGINENNLFLFATHTHSGLGAVTQNDFWSQLATDKFHPTVYKFLKQRVFKLIHKTFENLEPASLYHSHFLSNKIQYNRRNRTNSYDPLARMLLVRSNSSGAWLGSMVNYAVHGTALSDSNLKFSSDIGGAIERSLEKWIDTQNGIKHSRKSVVLFAPGAGGDVAPRAQGYINMTGLANDFVDQAKSSRLQLEKINPKWQVNRITIPLGEARTSLKKCLSVFFKRKDFHFEYIKPIINVSKWFPKSTQVWSIKLGHLQLFTWPGEPTTAAANLLRKAINSSSNENVWILSLTNEYLGYFTTSSEYKEKNYESCASLYGENGSNKIIQGHVRINK